MDIKESRSRRLVTAILVLLALAAQTSPALAQETQTGEGNKHPGFRMRSFVPVASGSLYFQPSPTGGIVRVTALGLPAPETLVPNAHVYVVWAVATGEKPLRAGELKVDESGNGGLEFARPAGFEKYSVIVTAEPDPTVDYPAGVMALASWGGAVTAEYGEKKNRLSGQRQKSLERDLGRATQPGEILNPFDAEVTSALKTGSDTHTVPLVGNEAAPGAYGLARVAARDENIYLHTIIRQLPAPSQVGANTYVLWGIVPSGRITYMGSLATPYGTDADEFVRVRGFNSSDVDLAVTAERKRPAVRLSGLRALSSPPADQPNAGPTFGAVEGQVLDMSGAPVSGATVEIGPDDPSITSGQIPHATTDQQGKFFLDGVPPGPHKIYASKESEGYPSAYMAFFGVGNTPIPQVTVENKQVTGGVTLHLGPKAAAIAGEVKDAQTHRPVEGAEIILYRDDNPDNYFSFGPDRQGKFTRLIPPAPLKLKVSAPGYQDWYYGKDGTKEGAEVLNVDPETSKPISVLLQRSRADR